MKIIVLSLMLSLSACTQKPAAVTNTALPATAESVSPETVKTLWVKSIVKETSCESDAKKLGETLATAGVKVLKTEAKHDGQMHAQMCGVATGEETYFQILAIDLEKARATGFTDVAH